MEPSRENSAKEGLEDNTDCVHSMAITSDNKYIVYGSEETTIRIWNFQDKIQEPVFPEPYWMNYSV